MEITPYERGILAGLANIWENPYPVGYDGYYISPEAEKWREGRDLGMKILYLLEKEEQEA